MMLKKFCSLFSLAGIFFASCSTTKDAVAEETKILSAAEQEKLLNNRYASGFLTDATFDSYCSILYAFEDIAIHTNSLGINNTELANVFPPGYKPTLKEIFDTIAYQTNAQWNYDTSTGYWLFTEAENNIPFSIKIAPGWQMQHRGVYVWFAPENANMGMDIYILGHYSTEDKDLLNKMRNMWAERMASGFDPNISVNDMKLVDINGNEAVYYEHDVRNEGTWRQWFLMIDSNLYGIVSALKNEDEQQLYKDVLQVINSLESTK